MDAKRQCESQLQRHIALIGMMGAGKSTVGAWLAEVEQLRYVDLDVAIEQRQGQSIPEIFQGEGEQTFRVIEQQVLAEVLDVNEPLLVACGGGVVVSEPNLKVLREKAWVCWLRANVHVLTDRVAQSRGRPLLGNDPLASITAISTGRAQLYAQAADEVIDVDDLRAEQVGEIIREVGPFVRS